MSNTDQNGTEGIVPPKPNPRSTPKVEELFPTTEVSIDIHPPFELSPNYIGRKDILEKLEDLYASSADEDGLVFSLLIADAGMGKSRTMKELASVINASDPDARILVGNCESSDKTYAAVSMLLSTRFGILPTDENEAAHPKIEAGIAEVLGENRVTEVAHLLAHLMRRPYIDSPVVTPIAGSHQQLEVRTFLALKRFCQADAKAGPLVLCFENLEQADPATINLVHFLVTGLANSRIMIVGSATSDLFESFPHFGDTDIELQTFSLPVLNEQESKELFQQLCSDVANLSDSLIHHASKLGGSPRAIFEMVRYLQETKVISHASTGWGIDKVQLTKTTLPASHKALVAARIRTMPSTDREVLHQASIVGETFWLDSIIALLRAQRFSTSDPDGPTLADIAKAGDHTKTQVINSINRLLHLEWLTEVELSSKEGEREYRFSYPLLWSSVYDDCQEGTRQAGHLRAAQWLELRPNGQEAQAQETIGRHLELAGDVRGASSRYRIAANHARKNFFNDKAIRLYSHALDCLGQADQAARIHLWHDLGSVYELKGDYEAAIGGFERMLRLSWIGASRTKAAVAFNKMGRVWRNKGDLKLSLDYLSRGLQLFEQAGDERGVAGSLDDIGRVHYLLGNLEEAYNKVTAGLQKRGKGGDKRSIASSLSTLGNIQRSRGFWEESLNCHKEALELRQLTGDRAGVAASLNNLAVVAFERGEVEKSREGWEKALKEAEDIGALPLQAHVLANLGEIALLDQRYEEARRRLTEGCSIAAEIADRRLEVEATRNLARLEHVLGNSVAARENAHRAHTIASDAGLRDYEGRALLTLAEVFGGTIFDESAQTDLDIKTDTPEPSAESYYKQGIDLMRTIGNETELAKGLESYGRYKIEQDDVHAGRTLLEQSLEIYSRLNLPQEDAVRLVLKFL